jgi:hypothetical protein
VGSSLGRGILAARHRELVAEHQDLQVLGGVAAGEQCEQLDGAAQGQVGGVWAARKVASEAVVGQADNTRAACNPQLTCRIAIDAPHALV